MSEEVSSEKNNARGDLEITEPKSQMNNTFVAEQNQHLSTFQDAVFEELKLAVDSNKVASARNSLKKQTIDSGENENDEEQRDKIGPLSGEDVDLNLPEKYERPLPRAGSMPVPIVKSPPSGTISPPQTPLDKKQSHSRGERKSSRRQSQLP